MLALAIALLCLGLFLTVHDLLHHLGLVPGLGRGVRIRKVRVHHGYLGLLLAVMGLALLLA